MSFAQELLVFCGPPGSGKGSLARFFADQLAWRQLSTGNLCRQHIIEQTPMGKSIDFAIKSGTLIADELVFQMVEEWLTIHGSGTAGVIFDGYPRTLAQASIFDDYLKLRLPSIRLTIMRLMVSDDQVLERLSQRYICNNRGCQAVFSNGTQSLMKSRIFMVCDHCRSPLYRRADDEEEIVRERLRVYHRYENQLLDFYRRIGYFIYECNGERPMKEIFYDFMGFLGIANP